VLFNQSILLRKCVCQLQIMYAYLASNMNVIENIRCTIKLKRQSETECSKHAHIVYVRSLQDLKDAAYWIYSMPVCVYSKSTGFSNSREAFPAKY